MRHSSEYPAELATYKVTQSDVVKGRHWVWQRRFLFTSVAALCTFLIHLLLPLTSPAQQVISTLGTKPIQHSIAFLAPPRYLGTLVRRVNLGNANKAITLTFDDGPWLDTTAQVLDTLKEKNIKATFFLIGQNLKKFPQLGQRIVADGHAIGNHTWHHWHRPMSEFTAAREIEDTAMLIQDVTGVKTYLFRPPNGFLYNGLADYALNHKQVVITWSIDSGDWHKHGISVEGLVTRVVENAKPGAIILLHDGGGDRSKTVQALPQMIDQLRKRGYNFVTVPELLQMKDREFAQKPNL